MRRSNRHRVQAWRRRRHGHAAALEVDGRAARARRRSDHRLSGWPRLRWSGARHSSGSPLDSARKRPIMNGLMFVYRVRKPRVPKRASDSWSNRRLEIVQIMVHMRGEENGRGRDKLFRYASATEEGHGYG